MAEDDELPPPLPSSPPPMAEDLPESPAFSSSEKFRALRTKIGSSRTMYSAPDEPVLPRAAPPTKRQRVANADSEPAEQDMSPSLSHRTRDRPRRKVRAPSRTALRENAAQAQSTDLFGGEGENDFSSPPPLPSTPPPLPSTPPPPPSSAPPPPPSSVPPLSLAPPQAHSPELAGWPAAQQGKVTEDQSDSESTTAPDTPDYHDTSSLGSTSALSTYSLGSGSGSRPGSGVEAKRMAIGSFSDRLKRIRQNRAARMGTPPPTLPSELSADTVSTLQSSPLITPTTTETVSKPADTSTALIVMDTEKSPRKQPPPLTKPKPVRMSKVSLTPSELSPERASAASPDSIDGRNSPPPPPLPSSPPPLPSSSPPEFPSTTPPNPPQMPPPTDQRDPELISKLNKWKRRSECLDPTDELVPPLTTKPVTTEEVKEELVDVAANRRSVSELVSKFNLPSETSSIFPEVPPMPPASPPPGPPTSPPPPIPSLPEMATMELDMGEQRPPSPSVEQGARALPPQESPPPTMETSPIGSTTPSPSAAYRNVKIISEGGVMHSPDLRFTRVAVKRWNKPPTDDLFASASTGDILSAPRKSSMDGSDMQKTSSLRSFGSSSESLTSDELQKLQKPLSPLIVSQAKESGKGTDSAAKPESDRSTGVQERAAKPSRSSFVESVLGSIPPISYSSSSSQENILQRKGGEEEAQSTAPVGGQEEQMPEMRQHQKVTEDLFRDSPGPLRPPTLFLDRDIFETSTDCWTVEQVCQWLELVGLGMYRQSFGEKGIDGNSLLHMDVQKFEELGIDSPEVREIILAKIYELGNPGPGDDMEDDFLLPVDSYTPEDWKKLQAAVDALKSPVLDDTVELDPSPIGQLQDPYPHSHSTPNIRRLNAELKFSERGTLSTSVTRDGIPVSSTVHSFPSYSDANDHHWSHPYSSMGGVSPLHAPAERRERSQTTPSSMTYTVMETLPSRERQALERGGSHGSASRQLEDGEKEREGGVLSLAHKLSEGNILFENGKFTAKKQRVIARGPSYWEQPPSGQETGLIRLYMDSVQKGSHYKAFLVTCSLTAGELIRQALEKANIPNDPSLFCIWEVAALSTGSSRALTAEECPLKLQTQWPHYNSHHFELRVKDPSHHLKAAVELAERQDKDEEMAQLLQLVEEKNQLILSLQKDLAGKDATIAQFQEQGGEGETEEVLALQRSLQEVSLASKEQQETSKTTISQLHEQVSRLELEDSRREQVALSIRTERDRLLREHKTKDALIQSLELDVARYRTLSSPSVDQSATVAVMERSLAGHERALGSLREEYHRQTIELRETEEEVKHLRKAQEEKERQLQAKLLERASLYSVIAVPSSERPRCLVTAKLEPTDVPGITLDSSPSGKRGCVVREVADSCTNGRLKQGDWLLEVDGSDVGGKSSEEVGKLLSACQGTARLVVSRALHTEYDPGSPGGMVIARFKRLSASLSTQLDTQSAQTDHWRLECERLKAEALDYLSVQKDKELELSLLQSTVHDLRQQLEDSEKSRSQLRQTLVELEQGRQSVDALEAVLREKEREIVKLKAAEKHKAKQLRTAQRDRERAVKSLRQFAVSNGTADLPSAVPGQWESLPATASQHEMRSALREVEDELAKHRAYLDQLLSVVIDHSPDLLSKMMEPKGAKSHTDSDSWC